MIEVVGAVRSLARRGKISAGGAASVLALNSEPMFERVDIHTTDFIRIWELRDNHPVADAAYIAVAERLALDHKTQVTIGSADKRMANSARATCDFALWPQPLSGN